MQPKVITLNQSIQREMELIEHSLRDLDRKINTNLLKQASFSMSEVNFTVDDSLFNGVLGGAGLMLLDLIIPGLTIALAGIFFLIKGIFKISGEQEKIKLQVCQLGLKKLNDSNEEILDTLRRTINLVFNNQVEAADTAIQQIISSYENLLEQQEKAHNETLEERQAAKAFIAQKRQELQLVQKQMEAILPS